MGATRLPARQWIVQNPVGMPGVADDKILWEGYLRRLGTSEGPLSSERAKEIRAFWELLERRLGPALRPPVAGALEDDGFAMSWDRGRHHFEIEVAPDGALGWFYMDRDSEVRYGEEDQLLSAVSPGLISQLRRTLGA